jgi:hypothetical protein
MLVWQIFLCTLVLLPRLGLAAETTTIPLSSGLYAPSVSATLAGEGDRWGRGSELSAGTRLELLQSGQAQLMPEIYTPTEQDWAAESTARQNKLGLWAQACCQPLDALGKIPLQQWRIIMGKVYSVSKRRNVVFINFALDWREDFTLILKPALAKKLQVESWTGKSIEARGWTEWYFGPAIRIAAPAQIRLLEATK